MKILVAIKSNKGAIKLRKNTLVWAARAGYNLRIFIPTPRQLRSYHRMIDQANYDYYLDLIYDVVLVGQNAKEYAKREGYDLLVCLPDDLPRWKKGDGLDGTVLHYITDIGKKRVEFSKNPSKRVASFSNGVKMYRV